MDFRDPSELLAEFSQVLWGRSDGAALWQRITKAVQTTVFPSDVTLRRTSRARPNSRPFSRAPRNSHYFLTHAVRNILRSWGSLVARRLWIGRRRRTSPMWGICFGRVRQAWMPLRTSSPTPSLCWGTVAVLSTLRPGQPMNGLTYGCYSTNNV